MFLLLFGSVLGAPARLHGLLSSNRQQQEVNKHSMCFFPPFLILLLPLLHVHHSPWSLLVLFIILVSISLDPDDDEPTVAPASTRKTEAATWTRADPRGNVRLGCPHFTARSRSPSPSAPSRWYFLVRCFISQTDGGAGIDGKDSRSHVDESGQKVPP